MTKELTEFAQTDISRCQFFLLHFIEFIFGSTYKKMRNL